MRFCCSLHEAVRNIGATIRAEGKENCFGRNITLRWRSRNANRHETRVATQLSAESTGLCHNDESYVRFGLFYVSTLNSRAQLITASRKAHLSADPHGISTKHERKPEIKSFTQQKKLFRFFFVSGVWKEGA